MTIAQPVEKEENQRLSKASKVEICLESIAYLKELPRKAALAVAGSLLATLSDVQDRTWPRKWTWPKLDCSKVMQVKALRALPP